MSEGGFLGEIFAWGQDPDQQPLQVLAQRVEVGKAGQVGSLFLGLLT